MAMLASLDSLADTMPQIFRGTPWTLDPSQPGVVIIQDSWPQWEKDMWTRALAAQGFTAPQTLWQPQYQSAAGLTVTQQGGATQQLNQQYFVTEDTANWLAQTYGAIVSAQPPEVAGGIESVPAGLVEYWLNWTTTTLKGVVVPYSLNAGLVAYYYCPAGGSPAIAVVQNPSVAGTNATAAIQAAELDALQVVR